MATTAETEKPAQSFQRIADNGRPGDDYTSDQCVLVASHGHMPGPIYHELGARQDGRSGGVDACR